MIMQKRQPFKPTIEKEEFSDGDKFLIGVTHYNQYIYLPALSIDEVIDLKIAIDDFLNSHKTE
jgi:hypothetical protein